MHLHPVVSWITRQLLSLRRSRPLRWAIFPSSPGLAPVSGRAWLPDRGNEGLPRQFTGYRIKAAKFTFGPLGGAGHNSDRRLLVTVR